MDTNTWSHPISHALQLLAARLEAARLPESTDPLFTRVVATTLDPASAHESVIGDPLRLCIIAPQELRWSPVTAGPRVVLARSLMTTLWISVLDLGPTGSNADPLLIAQEAIDVVAGRLSDVQPHPAAIPERMAPFTFTLPDRPRRVGWQITLNISLAADTIDRTPQIRSR